MNASFVALPETYLSTLRGVNQTITCIVFCPNHFESAARIDVDKLPELGGATDPPDPPSHTPMCIRDDSSISAICFRVIQVCLRENSFLASTKHTCVAHTI